MRCCPQGYDFIYPLSFAMLMDSDKVMVELPHIINEIKSALWLKENELLGDNVVYGTWLFKSILNIYK